MTTNDSRNALDFRKLILILVTVVIISIAIDNVVIETWNSVTTIISNHAMLSFLSMICAGFILVQYQAKEQREDTVLQSAFFYAAIVNIGRVVRITFDNSIAEGYGEVTPIINELVFLVVFSFLILAGILVKKKNWIKNRLVNSLVLLALGLILHSVMLFIVIPGIPINYIPASAMILGLATPVILPLSGILWMKFKSKDSNFDLSYMIAGFSIFGSAWLPFVATIFGYPSLWSLSYTLMTLGLIALCLGSSIPFLRRIGMRPQYAYIITLGLTALGVLPASLTVFVNSLVTLPTIVNQELFIIVHLGASLMAAVMTLLMFQYDKQKPAAKRRPIISLFIAWATIEFYQVVKAVVLPDELLSLSIIPYLIGILFLLVNIPFAIKWTHSPPPERQGNLQRVLIVAPIIFCTLIAGELLQMFVHSSPIGMSVEPLGQSLLLGASLVSMFTFVYHTSVQVRDGRGRITVDVLTTGFLALWIIPSMIKGIYSEWSTGWWTAEILLLMAVLFGPAILGFLYLKELSRAATSQKRATLFADLLVHDISNYHQALAFSIGLLEMEDASSETRKQAIRDANIELQRADQLIRNVRRLGMADELIPEVLAQLDLIPILNEAIELASRKNKMKEVRFKVDTPTEEYFVRANALLKDVFLNLFDNSIQYSDTIPEITVTISDISRDLETWCSIKITDNGRGIKPNRRAKIFERYMEDAVGSGLGLSVVKTLIQAYGGSITIENRVQGDYTKGTTFTILLKK